MGGHSASRKNVAAPFILACLETVRKQSACQDKWISDEGWANAINNFCQIKEGIEVNKNALNKAIGYSPQYKAFIDDNRISNSMGFYKATKRVDGKTAIAYYSSSNLSKVPPQIGGLTKVYYDITLLRGITEQVAVEVEKSKEIVKND